MQSNKVDDTHETAIRDQQGDILFLLDLSVEINKSNYKIFVNRIWVQKIFAAVLRKAVRLPSW